MLGESADSAAHLPDAKAYSLRVMKLVVRERERDRQSESKSLILKLHMGHIAVVHSIRRVQGLSKETFCIEMIDKDISFSPPVSRSSSMATELNIIYEA